MSSLNVSLFALLSLLLLFIGFVAFVVVVVVGGMIGAVRTIHVGVVNDHLTAAARAKQFCLWIDLTARWRQFRSARTHVRKTQEMSARGRGRPYL